MISANKLTGIAIKRKRVLRQVSKLREEIEDLMDYLDLVEARAKDLGKASYTTVEVRRKLGLD